VELLVTLALGGVVLGAFLGALHAGIQWSRVLAARSEGLEVVRTVWGHLEEEVGSGLPGRDWSLSPAGVIHLRGFRGIGWVCEGGAGRWVVGYRGRRLPDPARDSLLVLGDDGGWRAFPLGTVGGGGGCSVHGGELPLLLTWNQGGAPSPILVRIFERGELHLADGALRYRRGAAGRQPLTPERVGSGSHFHLREGWLWVRVEVDDRPQGGGLEPFEWPVSRGAGP